MELPAAARRPAEPVAAIVAEPHPGTLLAGGIRRDSATWADAALHLSVPAHGVLNVFFAGM